MTVFIIILIVVVLIAYSGGSKSQRSSTRKFKEPTKKSYPKITVEVKRSTSNSYRNDSIIDITGRSLRLDSALVKHPLRKVTQGVPYWQHQYVYSYSEITAANKDQQRFYQFFRDSFLKGVYVDLEGNTNYAFILFFHLLDEFLTHKDQTKVEHQLEILGDCYPKTSNYAIPELIKRFEVLGNTEAIQHLRDKQQERYQSQYYDYDSWKLGGKYKSKLNLNDSEVKLLNKVWQPSNNFCGIEYCCVQVAKLYLKTIDRLDSEFARDGSTIVVQFNTIADLVARKHFNYRANSSSYKYCLEQIENELYSTTFKVCENTVRALYDHKRKLTIDFYPNNALIHQDFQARVLLKLQAIQSSLSDTIDAPDKPTEIELNAQNTGRWKKAFDQITSKFKNDVEGFKKEIAQLASMNSKNPAIENIYFEASKFIAKSDKGASLVFYIYYIDADLKSAKFDNKQLTKGVQKSLFSSDEQLLEFGKVVNDLITTKNLEAAVAAVTQFYVRKRRKIDLNESAIVQAHKEHSGTVELLNEYLKDESENIASKTPGVATEDSQVQIEIKSKFDSTIDPKTRFTEVQQALLEYFQKNGLILSAQEIDSFAKSRGLFKNQLIESLNETCYETLDDVLIEEEEHDYTINDKYFDRILKL